MLRRALREPLVRFLLLGSLIFAADRALAARRPAETPKRIVIDRAFVDGLAHDQQRRTGAEPTARERAELVRGFVREEVLTREALAHGLDRGDPIVRRRLAQKMELWLQTTSAPPEPDDDALADYEAAHPDRYRDDRRTSFEHVYFASPTATGHDAARARAEAALAAPIDAHTGDGFAGGRSFVRLRDAEVTRLFGPGFADRLAEVPVDPSRWSAPIDGRFGVHLVRVSERVPARLPPLAEVRARVAGDEGEDARRAALEARVDALVASYEVVVR